MSFWADSAAILSAGVASAAFMYFGGTDFVVNTLMSPVAIPLAAKVAITTGLVTSAAVTGVYTYHLVRSLKTV